MNDCTARLREALGARVHTDLETRAAHARDTWVRSELDDLQGRAPVPPRAVVRATSTEDVATTLRLCREASVPVVTFGGGSGVCGGIRTREQDVVLSTAELAGLVAIDPHDLTATFRSGTNGLDAERVAQREGLTIGHWPQSIELSSVGGWVATRASGQYSTAYGNVEDLVLDLEAVLPDGSVLRTRRTPRASAGPDLRHLLLGSEGTLGVVTEVTFSLRPLPEASVGQSVHFATLAEGLEAVRRFVRAGWHPPVVRLYDAIETQRNFADPCAGRVLLLLLHEGPEARVAVEQPAVAQICVANGGVEGPASLVDRWLEHRNRVPGFRGFLEKGIVLDTIEVAATWQLIVPLYERVVASLREVPGLLSASAHSSHSYRSGTNLYFTFAARPENPEQMASTYAECWRRVMEAAIQIGAGIAHHHGIGRVRRDFLSEELGPVGVSLLRAVKRALDPEGLLNPGVLLPEPEA